ncbi:ABC transporter substrate-binding protein [Rhabdaerophilum calidifontis]|uniref:ABC transporter substrate-binding protein n=1 Tax=Rhabdaerophilum calidifontis TaxID=2604328 RepID=UPI001407B4AD|nr:PhnD/SsuA/transferrin family substrate-binding protein [Rhabdaerophilum calidifontis]
MNARISRPSRRDTLAALTALAMPALARPARAAPLAELVLHGPPAGASITLAHAAATGALAGIADKVSFKPWRNPDEMRAGLTSGTMQLVVMPTLSAANLFNRGLGVRLVNVMTNGLLYIVAADPAIRSFAALKGKRVALPFRNDTPEFVFNRLMREHGFVAGRDLTLETTGTPIEAVQLLLAGRIDAALAPEPAGTAAMLRGAVAGKTIERVIDIQAEWRRLAGPAATLPQAGLAASRGFLERHADLLPAIQAALTKANAEVLAAPARAAGNAASALDLPWPVIEKSIPVSNLVTIPAREARPQLEAMFALNAEADPALIGGKMPPAEFYL